MVTPSTKSVTIAFQLQIPNVHVCVVVRIVTLLCTTLHLRNKRPLQFSKRTPPWTFYTFVCSLDNDSHLQLDKLLPSVPEVDFPCVAMSFTSSDEDSECSSSDDEEGTKSPVQWERALTASDKVKKDQDRRTRRNNNKQCEYNHLSVLISGLALLRVHHKFTREISVRASVLSCLPYPLMPTPAASFASNDSGRNLHWLQKVTSWFHGYFTEVDLTSAEPINSTLDLHRLFTVIRRKSGTQLEIAILFVSLCRGLGTWRIPNKVNNKHQLSFSQHVCLHSRLPSTTSTCIRPASFSMASM